jgi:PIN domain nuclease of toxin-antitoxin system
MIILDTHVLVWLDEGNSKLGKSALQKIDRSLPSGELGVATISFWEVAMLVNKGRIDMHTDLSIWRSELINAGLKEIPLLGTTAIRSAELNSFHGDPADRIIVATAIENSATLITADKKILSWEGSLHVLDARL